MTNNDKKEIIEDINKYKSLDVLAKSEGGQILIDNQYKKIADTTDTIANGYTQLSHAELLGYCAYLKANLDVLKALKNAEGNLDLAEEALKNADSTE